jgi:hypothetical protein
VKNKINKPNLNINVNKDDSELNDFLYCWEQFGTRPNKIVIHNNYSGKSFLDVIKTHTSDSTKVIEVIPSDDQFVINEKAFSKINDDIYCSFIVIDKNLDTSIVSELTFFFSNKEIFEEIQGIIEELNSCLLDFCEEHANNLNTISIGQNGVEIEPIETEFDIDSFDLYYSKKTTKEINKLLKEIKKSKKGLSILYGERGTGKTSVINYLAHKLDRIVIFIPNNMIESTINSPDFRKFLKRYDRPVIVIDDCEMLLSEYFTKSNLFSNNLLQMIDGLLSDSIETNVITIFNVEDEEEIDHCLLECNNLIKVINFDKLSGEESTELSEFIGHNKKIKNKSKLIDIIKNRPSKDNFEIGL